MIKGDKYLITSDNWFICPDGKQYRAVFGKVEVLGDNVLGIETNRNSSNWYVKVGSDDSYIIIAGCQIHFAIRTESVELSETIKELKGDNNELKEVDNPIFIFK